MYNSKIVDTVNKILQEKFEVPSNDIALHAKLKEDLKLDSLDFVEMFIILESKTGSTVKDIDFMSIQTVEDIYKLVSSLSVEKPLN